MPKKSAKSRSKRTTLHQKYKVIKKIKEHHRKKAKELRKKGGRVKAPKDPGIPNSWPFKEQLVKELEFERERAEAATAARKEAAKHRRALRRSGEGEGDDDEMEEAAGGGAGLDEIASRAASRATVFDAAAGARAARVASGVTLEADADRSRRAFYKEFVKVVDAADVIIQVLDARDPLACRAPEVERFVRSRGADKKVVLLLNKIDLVPRHAAEAWLAYFRDELPTVAFKCATSAGGASAGRKQMPRSGAGGAEGVGGGECVGADMLIGLLKNYARSRSMKTAISVGIVGLPNVGKSSLINSLCRARAAATGATPGLTRAAQEVQLDKHVKLLDSPGIVFSTAGAPGDAAAALRNAIRVEKLEDPVAPCEEILRRAKKETLMELYAIPRFVDVSEFLRHVAAKRGKLKRGGIPDALAAARIVLGDWNAGRIPFFTLPPARGNAEHNSAQVVAAFGADFDVSALNSAVIDADAAPGAHADTFMQMPSAAAGEVHADLTEMDEGQPAGAAEEEEDAAPSVKAKRGKADKRQQNEVLYGEDAMHNPKAARAAKKQVKKAGGATAALAAATGGGGADSDGEFDWEATTADARAQAAMRMAADARADDGEEEEEEEEGDAMDD